MPGEAFAEGVRRLQANDFPGAIYSLQQASQETPNDGRIFGYLGMAYARVGDNNNSVLALQHATRLMPQDAGAFYNLAVALVQAERMVEARAALERSLSFDPNNPKAQAAWQSLASYGAPSAPSAPATTAPGPFDLSEVASGPGAPTVPPMPAPQPYAQPPAYGAPQQPTVMSLTGEPVPQVSSLPPTYQTPPLASGQPYYGTPGSPPVMGGMQYSASPTGPGMRTPTLLAPTFGQRVGRGLAYGALFGQWWTLWIFVFDLLIHGGLLGRPLALIGLTIFFAIIFAIIGAVAGLIIGLADLDAEKGTIVGVVFGLLLLGIEFFLAGSNGAIFLNIFFWVFTGRFIGSNIGKHVQKPVQA